MTNRFINLNGKGVVGYMDTERRIYCSKRRKEHFFRKFKGFGMSCAILDTLIGQSIENIEIEFEGHILKANVSKFLVKGIEFYDGADLQLILPLNYFIIDGGRNFIQLGL